MKSSCKQGLATMGVIVGALFVIFPLPYLLGQVVGEEKIVEMPPPVLPKYQKVSSFKSPCQGEWYYSEIRMRVNFYFGPRIDDVNIDDSLLRWGDEHFKVKRFEYAVDPKNKNNFRITMYYQDYQSKNKKIDYHLRYQPGLERLSYYTPDRQIELGLQKRR